MPLMMPLELMILLLTIFDSMKVHLMHLKQILMGNWNCMQMVIMLMIPMELMIVIFMIFDFMKS
jgi:hypothetical protein